VKIAVLTQLLTALNALIIGLKRFIAIISTVPHQEKSNGPSIFYRDRWNSAKETRHRLDSLPYGRIRFQRYPQTAVLPKSRLRIGVSPAGTPEMTLTVDSPPYQSR
jgi:hypothetical protein